MKIFYFSNHYGVRDAVALILALNRFIYLHHPRSLAYLRLTGFPVLILLCDIVY